MVESSRKVFVHPEMALIQLCILSTIIANSLTQYVRDSNGKNKALSANQGQIPPCVTEPGQTFCEEVPNYPYELIWNALKKAPFDVSKLLVDETPDSPDLGPLTFKEISKLTQDNYSAKTQKHSTTSNHEGSARIPPATFSRISREITSNNKLQP
ncbi:hypothetical protein ABEB36_012248 [Hypothenemus hampei]|uniref:Uncharacterized protein n=1 Tax=Hypothenemus hampei TaxID=57062 RepID=A0ABD1ECK1_HYPHA